MKRILVMGLPGCGKTTFAKELQKELGCTWFNADQVREQFNDWDFSLEGRLRQARRMRQLTDILANEISICDFVCPLQEMRDIFEPDIIVWMNTKQTSLHEDTNKLFEIPVNANYIVTDFGQNKKVIKEIINDTR